MIVSNSTPLIAFARIGELELLQKLVQHVLVPEAVWQEVTEAGHRPGAEETRKAMWVEARAVRVVPPELVPLLDRGEVEAIALAEEVTADELLLDERAARAIATARGLNIIGSAGLLARAKQQGMIPTVRPFLERMQTQGIRYGQRFVEEFLRQLGEESYLKSPYLALSREGKGNFSSCIEDLPSRALRLRCIRGYTQDERCMTLFFDGSF